MVNLLGVMVSTVTHFLKLDQILCPRLYTGQGSKAGKLAKKTSAESVI